MYTGIFVNRVFPRHKATFTKTLFFICVNVDEKNILPVNYYLFIRPFSHDRPLLNKN